MYSMDVLELRAYLLDILHKKYSVGVKAKYIIDFAEKYILETKQHEIPIVEIYRELEIPISYNHFVRVLNKKWKLQKTTGGRLILNNKYQKTK